MTISMANPSESRDATALLTEGETTYMTANKMTRYTLVSRSPAPSFKARECIHFDSFGKLVGSKEFDMAGVVIGTDQKVRVKVSKCHSKVSNCVCYSKRSTSSTRSWRVKTFI